MKIKTKYLCSCGRQHAILMGYCNGCQQFGNIKPVNTETQDKGLSQVSDKGRTVKEQDQEFFKKLWDSKPHITFIKPQRALNYKFEKKMFFVFSHVLAKGTFPNYRHREENIVFMTLEEHQTYQNVDPEYLRELPEWEPVFKLHDKLEAQYNREFKISKK